MPPSSIPSAHRAMLRDLDRFLRESDRVLAAWRVYSEEHTDLDGWPFDDDAYGRRATDRDAAVAESFDHVRGGAAHLLATARAQLVLLPTGAAQSRWAWQLTVLQDALDRLGALRETWRITRDSLPPNAGPRTSAFDDTHAAHLRAAGAALNEWAVHGHAIREIDKAARSAPFRLVPRPATSPAQTPARVEAAQR
ncbi:hypothetical protein [Streptomyces fragilis]|uniref:Uncharacterized protein n=1 Tax=Streptomyces fragilis TaxID=67301 RepID=A0ABV2YCV3_9ACTN|nr:hypothetical protein [Streptomyces fragilis]